MSAVGPVYLSSPGLLIRSGRSSMVYGHVQQRNHVFAFDKARVIGRANGCLQLAFISLEKNPPSDASDAANDSTSLSAACGGHNSSFPIATRQSKVSPLAVAEHWFAELTVNMEKVLEVSRHLLALYDLWQRFDSDEEMPNIMLKKMPRPVVQSSQQQQQPPPPSNQSAPFRSRQQSVQSQPTAAQSGGAVSHSPNGGTAMDQQQLRQMNPAVGGGGGGGGGGHMQGRMGQPPYPFVAPKDF